MKNLIFVLMGATLSISAAACSGVSKTSAPAPDSPNAEAPVVQEPTAQANQDDATSELRRRQMNADIRAVEERAEAIGDGNKADGDLESQVRSKLEANLPASALAVDAKDGMITVTGSVVNEEQFKKISPLAREINGVKEVMVEATIAVETPAAPDPAASVPIRDQTNSN
jgi:hyperosmotically inducible periplasmic protein